MKIFEDVSTKDERDHGISHWVQRRYLPGILDKHTVVTNAERETKSFVLPFFSEKGGKGWELWFTEHELDNFFASYAHLKKEKATDAVTPEIPEGLFPFRPLVGVTPIEIKIQDLPRKDGSDGGAKKAPAGKRRTTKKAAHPVRRKRKGLA